MLVGPYAVSRLDTQRKHEGNGDERGPGMKQDYEDVHVVIPRRVVQDVLDVYVLDLVRKLKHRPENP